MTIIFSTNRIVLQAIEGCEKEIDFLKRGCERTLREHNDFQERLEGEQIKLNLLKGFPLKKEKVPV